MKRIVIILSSLALIGLAIAIMGLMSGNNRTTAAYKFYYYPKLNAYYDFEYNYYLYTLDGGKTWREKPAMHRDQATALGEHIVLTNEEREIWRYNALHRQQYSGVVYNFVSPTKRDKEKAGTGSYSTNDNKGMRKQRSSNKPSQKPRETEVSPNSDEEATVKDGDGEYPKDEVEFTNEQIEKYIGRKTEELRQRIERHTGQDVDVKEDRD